jgi:hypothetical protein
VVARRGFCEWRDRDVRGADEHGHTHRDVWRQPRAEGVGRHRLGGPAVA